MRNYCNKKKKKKSIVIWKRPATGVKIENLNKNLKDLQKYKHKYYF